MQIGNIVFLDSHPIKLKLGKWRGEKFRSYVGWRVQTTSFLARAYLVLLRRTLADYVYTFLEKTCNNSFPSSRRGFAVMFYCSEVVGGFIAIKLVSIQMILFPNMYSYYFVLLGKQHSVVSFFFFFFFKARNLYLNAFDALLKCMWSFYQIPLQAE